MRCVVAIAEYVFEAPLDLLSSPAVKIHRLLFGREPDSPPPEINRRLNFDDPTKRLRTLVTRDRWNVFYQPTGAAIDTGPILAAFASARSLFAEARVIRIGIKTQWIEPTEGGWEALTDRFVRTLFRPGPVYASLADAAIIIDEAIEGPGPARGHIQIGPMKQEQLKEQHVVFDKEQQLPECMLFIDIDYLWTPDRPVSENAGRLERALRDGLQYANGVTERVASQFGGEL